MALNEVPRYAYLVLDDHPVMRLALSSYLERGLRREALRVATARDVQEATRILEPSPERWIVLCDLMLPGPSGLDAIRRLRSMEQVLAVVVVSGADPLEWERKARDAGAAAFLSKALEPADLVANLRAVALACRPNLDRLSCEQREVLRCVAAGASNSVIAAGLGLAEDRVRIQVALLSAALQAGDRMQLVREARRLGLLPGPDGRVA